MSGAALPFHVGSPAWREANHLDRCLLYLCSYYSQSKGKKAQGIRDRIDTIVTEHKRPGTLVPFDAEEAAKEPAAFGPLRRKYYVEELRPVLVDPTFLQSIRQTIVRSRTQDLCYPDEVRTEAIAAIEAAPAYWDAHFAVTAADIRQ